MQVATAEGIAYVTANNYTKVRQEGWVRASRPAGPAGAAYVKLQQFYNMARTDHYLVAPSAVGIATRSGYHALWDEGWAPDRQFAPGTWSTWQDTKLPQSTIVPFAQSEELHSLQLDLGSATGNLETTGGDTWFVSWGADDKLYSSYADGRARTSDNAAAHCATGGQFNHTACWQDACCSERHPAPTPTNPHGVCGGLAHAGYAVFDGSDPLNQTLLAAGTTNATAAPFYSGRYPSASLHLDGVWYFGTYMLSQAAPPYDWDVLGPLVSIRTSSDGGGSWDEPRYEQKSRNDSVFGECETQAVGFFSCSLSAVAF